MRLIAYYTLTLLALASSTSAFAQLADTDSGESALANAVYTIFDRSCAECHDGTSRARSKGRFGTVMDFAAMRADSGLIVPGDAEDSEIYLVIVDSDPEFVMPPPDSDCPPLSDTEAELVKMWINAGAPDPALETEPTAIADLVESAPEQINDSKNMDASTQNIPKAIGKLHPIVVHFPIATIWLAFIAAISQKIGFAKKTDSVIHWSLATGALIAVASVASGWINAEFSGYSDESVWRHRWSGVAVAVLASLSLFFFVIKSHSEKRAFTAAYWSLLILAVLSVSFAGHTGGILVYGEETFFHLLR